MTSINQLFDLECFIHSLKTAIACIIGFTITKMLNLPSDVWIVVTIIVVMCAQLYVGSVLQKAYLRFLGTLLGCLFAALMISTLGINNLNIALTLGIVSMIFSYWAVSQETLSYTGTLGAVTTSIILLGNHPTLLLAFQRFLEISIGLLIATLVSQFILPISARAHLRREQAATLGELRDYYVMTLIDYQHSKTNLDYHDLDERIVKLLIKQRQLAKESKREPFGSVFNPQHFLQSLYCEKEILRAITAMHIALTQLNDQANGLIASKAFQSFSHSVLENLNELIVMMQSDTLTSITPITIPSVDPLKFEFSRLATTLWTEKPLAIDGFLFSATLLTNSLANLATLFKTTEGSQD